MYGGVPGDMLLTLWPLDFLKRCILYIRRSNLGDFFLFACCVNLHPVLLPIPIFNSSRLYWLFTILNILACGRLFIPGTRCSFLFSWVVKWVFWGLVLCFVMSHNGSMIEILIPFLYLWTAWFGMMHMARPWLRWLGIPLDWPSIERI